MMKARAIQHLFDPAAGPAAVQAVPGIDEGARCTSVPATSGDFAGWKPRPPRYDVTRGITILGNACCSVDGEVCDASGMRLWNLSHKQRKRRPKTWIEEKLAFHRRRLEAAVGIRKPVLSLAASTAGLYFHWLVDVLPRLAIARNAGVGRGRAIYASVDRPFQHETLHALGLRDRVIDASETPLIECHDIAVPCHQLACGHLPPDWVIRFLRDELYPHLAPARSAFPRRIYVSRRDADRRRVLNEDDLMDVLAPLGFELVAPGEMSVAEQAGCFRNADLIVSAHGSGLANLAFCSPGTTLVELFPNRYFDDGPYRLSRAMRLNYLYVRERVAHGSGLPIRTDYAIEPEDVLNTLDLALEAAA